MRFSEADARLLERCMVELALRTDAEVVCLARQASGHYRDVDACVGAATAFAAMLLLLFLPFEVSEAAVPLPVALCFGLGWAVSHALGLPRYLTRARRRGLQARRAAEAAFVEKGIHRTTSRLGCLVYLSFLERKAVILVDRGLEEKLDARKLAHFEGRLEWVSRARGPRRARALGEFLRSFGVFLGHACPSRSGRHELAPTADFGGPEDEA